MENGALTAVNLWIDGWVNNGLTTHIPYVDLMRSTLRVPLYVNAHVHLELGKLRWPYDLTFLFAWGVIQNVYAHAH